MILTLISRSWEDTVQIGGLVGRLLRSGIVVPLIGEIGAGKTCLVHGICLGLGLTESSFWGSPTFTILHLYEARLPICHYDFYRLSSADEILDLGIEDHFDGCNVVLMEWPETVLPYLPAERLEIRIDFPEVGRQTIRRICFSDPAGCYHDLLTLIRTNSPSHWLRQKETT